MFAGIGIGVGFNLGGGGDPYTAFFGANADFYIGMNPTVDNDADVTTVQMTGKIGGTLARAGASGAITKGADGLVFPGGRSLDISGLSGSYGGALILVDATATANPAATATVIRAEATLNAQCLIRQLTNGTWQNLGPNNGSSNFEFAIPSNARSIFGFITDTEGVVLGAANRQSYVERDGLLNPIAMTGTTANLGLDSLTVGLNYVGKLHQVAIFLIPVGGALPDTVERLWARMAGATIRTFATDAADLMIVDGQSLVVGPVVDATQEATYNLMERRGALMLSGMQDSAANVITSLVRPSSLAYNESISATGTKPAAVSGAFNMGLRVAAALIRMRPDGENPIIATSHAYAGVPIAELDNSSATGTTSLVIFNNNDYWCDQAAAVLTAQSRSVGRLYKLLIQGTGDKDKVAGYWIDLAQDWWDQHGVDIAAAFPGSTPVLVLGQSAGDADTSSAIEYWAVCDEQIDFAEANGGLLVAEYPFEIADNNVHPGLDSGIRLGETIAWAIREYELGNDWNLGRPTASRAGGTITLTYPAWAMLEFSPDVYSGQGIANYGFEVTGATISGVSLAGNVITITTSGGTPTAVQYAYQKQDVTGFGGNAYTAHRGLLRTTERQTGPISGGTLYQWAPSFMATI